MPSKRQLTEGCASSRNGGLDTADCDLVLHEGDILFNPSQYRRYKVLSLLGCGTFGQVALCTSDIGQEVAVKVIKNQPAYFNQAVIEANILKLLNNNYDPVGDKHVVRMLDYFVHANHLCIVFERLHANLYEILKWNSYKGLSLSLACIMVKQILECLCTLRVASIVHCDLKPENILLASRRDAELRVIDFGSACFENRTVYSYVQSRFYRSPEVILGHTYSSMVDMWSLGCIAAELFLGLPLFPGASDYDMIKRITQYIDSPSPSFLSRCSNAHRFFQVPRGGGGGGGGCAAAASEARPQLMNEREYEARTGKPPEVGRLYFKHLSAVEPACIRLDDVVLRYPVEEGDGSQDVDDHERYKRYCFLNFLQGVLAIDPAERWTPWQALQHPLMTGEPFTGPFEPPPEPLDMQPFTPSLASPRPYNSPHASPSCSSANHIFGMSLSGNHGNNEVRPNHLPTPAGFQPLAAPRESSCSGRTSFSGCVIDGSGSLSGHSGQLNGHSGQLNGHSGQLNGHSGHLNGGGAAAPPTFPQLGASMSQHVSAGLALLQRNESLTGSASGTLISPRLPGQPQGQSQSFSGFPGVAGPGSHLPGMWHNLAEASCPANQRSTRASVTGVLGRAENASALFVGGSGGACGRGGGDVRAAARGVLWTGDLHMRLSADNLGGWREDSSCGGDWGNAAGVGMLSGSARVRPSGRSRHASSGGDLFHMDSLQEPTYYNSWDPFFGETSEEIPGGMEVEELEAESFRRLGGTAEGWPAPSLATRGVMPLGACHLGALSDTGAMAGGLPHLPAPGAVDDGQQYLLPEVGDIQVIGDTCGHTRARENNGAPLEGPLTSAQQAQWHAAVLAGCVPAERGVCAQRTVDT